VVQQPTHSNENKNKRRTPLSLAAIPSTGNPFVFTDGKLIYGDHYAQRINFIAVNAAPATVFTQ
jgi:hypothetical protein